MANPYVNSRTNITEKKKKLQARWMKLKSSCKAMFGKGI